MIIYVGDMLHVRCYCIISCIDFRLNEMNLINSDPCIA